MSDPGSPSDPFGRSDRTIIRPNPAGRRAPLPSRPAPAPAASPAPYEAPAVASPGVPGSGDDWMSASAAPSRPAPLPQPTPGGPLSRREQLLTPNANPLLRAAGPLLLLLGRLRSSLSSAPPAQLLGQVSETIEAYEPEVRAAGVSAEQARTAKYIVCAAADDIVQNIPGEDRHVWTQYSMLSRFFGERIGGVRFFEELDRAKLAPLVNYPILELMHACLALGFQGLYRTSGGGQASLQQIQRDLYEILRRVRPKVNQDLSPRWRGQALASRLNKIEVPVWAVAAVAGVLLFGLFVVLRFLLGGGSEATAEALSTLHPNTKLALERRVFAPPPPPPPPPPPDRITQLQRIRARLAPEIAAGKLTAEQNATQIFVRVGDLVLFDSGQASVLDSFKPIIPRIAAALDPEPGEIKVVGHTDSVPLRTIRFQSNWHLSVERAKTVGTLLKQSIKDPNRIQTDGKGPDQPIASNDNQQGRARNRRVEIMIPRED